MSASLQLLHPEEELNPQNLLIEILKSYPEKTVHPDKTVTTEYIETNYFLDNDEWDVDFFFKIKQFQSQEATYKVTRRKFKFTIENQHLKLEFKYLVHTFIFQEKWSIITMMHSNQPRFKKLFNFLDEQYSSLNTLLDLDVEKAEKKWLLWLTDKGIKTTVTQKKILTEYDCRTPLANTLRNMYDDYNNLMDTREEWEKDSWDVRVLNQKYGIDFTKSTVTFKINFHDISNLTFQSALKKYCKQRLLSRNFAVSTAQGYAINLTNFFNFITELEPTWNDLKGLNRQHIEQYLVYLTQYAHQELTQENSNPANYIASTIGIINTFLLDIQKYEYEIAPLTPMSKLIYDDDRPKLPKSSASKIKYIPQFVLDQLFQHLDDLHHEVVPIVYIAFRTGLRISDVLELKTDCLVQVNGVYSIVTDIRKVKIEGHSIPIDDELAKLLALEIKQSKDVSNQDNNPENLIFVRYRGSRKGYPYSAKWVQSKLNILAHQKQIKDEQGKLFHFTMHKFRHTYGVKLVNNGTDFVTIQNLLAHSSPEMTLTYAQVLDTTKRKAFDEAMDKGVFTIQRGNKVVQYQPGEDIPKDVLEMLYLNHKLTAMDNPYGTCYARLTNQCPHMDEPPCLTCSGGKPCKHLAIGFSENDIPKYELLVKTTSRTIQYAEEYGRDDIKNKNQKNLELYQSILSNLQAGEIIFGNLEKLKEKRGS